ncbi:MAG: response regulator [Phycisphaerales bacterium]|nr:response regulator [Phycisphaerales bacterium]
MAAEALLVGRIQVNHRRRLLFYSALITACSTIAVTVVAVFALYGAAVEKHGEILAYSVRSRARLIETMAQSDKEFAARLDIHDPTLLTLEKLVEAHESYPDFGMTGEFTLAKRVGDQIVFLLSRRHDSPTATSSIPWSSEAAEPMRRALSGQSGSAVLLDYRGESVLAAYEPLRGLPFGIVSKFDLSEIRAPFFESALIMSVAVLLLIAIAVGLTYRVYTPILNRIDEANAKLIKVNHDLSAQKFALDKHNIVSIANVKGDITYVNDTFCEISGFSREELIGQNHRIVKSDVHSAEFYRTMWRTISKGQVWQGVFKNRRKDGSFYWVDATIVPFKDENGKIREYVAIRTDVTKLKKIEEKLSQINREHQLQQEKLQEQQDQLIHINANLQDAQAKAILATRAKSEFLANMSHEIRTPMTAILGFTETIADNVTEPETIEATEIIRRNGEHLLGIINDILDLSKIEAGKMTIERIPCSPHEIASEVASLIRVRVEAKGLKFNIETIGAIPESIQSDPTRVRQILLNLVGNSVKFTEVGGVRLILRFTDNDSCPMMQFDVVDTGIGMSEQKATKLFQAFSQGDTSMARQFGGTGLGLTISKRFAEMLGGDISIVDTQEGVGTRFRATVTTGPLDGVRMVESPRSTNVVKTKKPKAVANANALAGCRILLAEDGPDNQRLISHVLKKAGADVEVAENGQIALDKAMPAVEAGNPFDVILMDMQMPVLDGYTATSLLRVKGYTGPIIALTAHAMTGDREKCIKAGCDDYTTKPIDRKKLIELIQAHSQTRMAKA